MHLRRNAFLEWSTGKCMQTSKAKTAWWSADSQRPLGCVMIDSRRWSQVSRLELASRKCRRFRVGIRQIFAKYISERNASVMGCVSSYKRRKCYSGEQIEQIVLAKSWGHDFRLLRWLRPYYNYPLLTKIIDKKKNSSYVRIYDVCTSSIYSQVVSFWNRVVSAGPQTPVPVLILTLSCICSVINQRVYRLELFEKGPTSACI